MSVANLPSLHSQGDPAVPETPIFRLTVEQYHDMIRADILTEDDPVELLEGWLVFKMSKNPPHRIATKKLTNALERIVPPGWYVDAQEPITTADSEPEPDVMVIRGNTEDYPDHHPAAVNLSLVVEVADSSLDLDRRTKSRLYARAGIPTYWIVNLLQRQVEVYSSPRANAENPSYVEQRTFLPGESVPLIVDGREIGRIEVADVLP